MLVQSRLRGDRAGEWLLLYEKVVFISLEVCRYLKEGSSQFVESVYCLGDKCLRVRGVG